MRREGFSIIEAIVAVAILATVLAVIIPVFTSNMQLNTRMEMRSGAVVAARQQLERLRIANPGNLPASGATGPVAMNVGGRAYQVLTRYCTKPAYCGASSRHLQVEVSHGGQSLYTVETIYTQLNSSN